MIIERSIGVNKLNLKNIWYNHKRNRINRKDINNTTLFSIH